MVLHLPSEPLVKKRKNHFRKDFNVEITQLKSLKFSENDVSPRIPIEKDSWHIITQLNSWCTCLGERKNPISDVIFLRRIKLKRQFPDNFIFSFAFWKDRCLRSGAFKSSLQKMWFIMPGDKKVKKLCLLANSHQQYMNKTPEPWKTFNLQGLVSLKAFKKYRR